MQRETANNQSAAAVGRGRKKGGGALPSARGGRANGTPSHRGLSAKLLLLTLAAVMAAEVFVFVPSVANYRKNWLLTRLQAAHIASLANEAAVGAELPTGLRHELLDVAQVRAVAVKRDFRRRLVLQHDMPARVDASFDLRDRSFLGLIGDALYVFVAPAGRMINVRGQPQNGHSAADAELPQFVEIVLPEAPLRADMINYGLNILGLSIIISLFTASLVYLALNWLLVRPMTRIMTNMVRFSDAPEDTSRIIRPSSRKDEVGTTERELAQMQQQLSQMLKEKSRLASLGLAVSKVNHDLRNMLASAQLVSDRFGGIDDPTVQRFAPKLIGSLDRAIRLCNDTLKYGRASEAPPARSLFELRPLVDEVAESLALSERGRLEWRVDVEDGLVIDADRDQLFRVLSNLLRNACEAMEGKQGEAANRLSVGAGRRDHAVEIRLSDTGPGIPQRTREHLFEAFHNSARDGGSGLGLAISAELVTAHGGRLELRETGSGGSVFAIVIPDSAAD